MHKDDYVEIINHDVEVIEDKFLAIKKIYPNALDEQIKKAMNILESKFETY